MQIRMKDGRGIYVEHHRNGRPRTILMIHGGPGESCITFPPLAKALADTADVVLADQRGVLRSEAESDENKLNVEQVLQDFEEIREALGIVRWTILGHSFGGRLAAAYAGKYTKSVEAVILENPAVDIEKSVNALLKKYELLFTAFEKKFPDALSQMGRLKEARSGDFSEKLGFIARVPAKYRCICFGNLQLSREAQKLFLYPGFSEEEIKKGQQVMAAMSRDKDLLTDGCLELEKSEAPLLLLRDEEDPLLSAEELRYFKRRGTVCGFSGCGHYIHLAAPQQMAGCIRRFFDI